MQHNVSYAKRHTVLLLRCERKNALIFCGGIGIVCAVRAAYMEVVENLFPQGIGSQGILPALLTGGVLFIAVCLLNIVIIRRKINFIWWERMKKK